MALVVTIVILIILATNSINAVLGEKGLIKKAQQAKEMYEKSVQQEEEAMNELMQEYENAMKDPPKPYEDEALATMPKIAEGMQKIKYNSSTDKWERVTGASEEWYDYENKQWANVVLPAEGTLDSLFNSDGTLNEDKKYVQLVWIPRFAYKITSQYHTGGTGAGDIEVVFIDTANQNKSKTKTYSTTYPSATEGVSSGMSDFVVHPAFEYGETHLPGFWMGKFESSHTGCTQTASTGTASYTGNEVIMVKPNVTSWREITIGDSFITCLNMNKSGNPYGLSTSDSVVDPHMAKNDEWGAVAYLSKSKYGKQTEEVFINNNGKFITGIAGDTVDASSVAAINNTYKTAKGIKASTTGNATGIYDMSGGAFEYVAAYVNNGHGNLTDVSYGKALTEGAAKYKNVYSKGSSDTSANNYAVSTPANGHYGDTVYETSQNGTNTNPYAWYSDDSIFPASSGPFFVRGGACTYASGAGVFYFGCDTGGGYSYGGFRVVVPVL